MGDSTFGVPPIVPRSLLTRIHHRFLLPPASLEDTTEDVRYRLSAAGTDRALFPGDALAGLHEHSQGALREIDRLASAPPST